MFANTDSRSSLRFLCSMMTPSVSPRHSVALSPRGREAQTLWCQTLQHGSTPLQHAERHGIQNRVFLNKRMNGWIDLLSNLARN